MLLGLAAKTKICGTCSILEWLVRLQSASFSPFFCLLQCKSSSKIEFIFAKVYFTQASKLFATLQLYFHHADVAHNLEIFAQP